MKQDECQVDCKLKPQIERGKSGSKTYASGNTFVQHDRKKKRMHSNSILNQVKLSEKPNQQNIQRQQQKKSRLFKNCRQNSIKIKITDSKSQLTINPLLQVNPSLRVPNICQLQNTNHQQPVPSNLYIQNHLILNRNCQQIKTYKKWKSKYFMGKGSNNKMNKPKKKDNQVLSSINIKLRQLSNISRKFDKANQSYSIKSTQHTFNYSNKASQTDKTLKAYQSKLGLRKNLITQRKNQPKFNLKFQQRQKALHRRVHTQAPEKQNIQFSGKHQGIWHEDAKKLKNYISGGYTDQKEQYSDFCDLDQYKKFKKNFLTFQQIYNSIKQDRDNPISKISLVNLKRPNILQLVTAMEKQHELHLLENK